MNKKRLFSAAFALLFIGVFTYMAAGLLIHNIKIANDPNRMDLEGVVLSYNRYEKWDSDEKRTEVTWGTTVQYEYKGSLYTYDYPNNKSKDLLPEIGSKYTLSINKNDPLDAYVSSKDAVLFSLLFCIFVLCFDFIVIFMELKQWRKEYRG